MSSSLTRRSAIAIAAASLGMSGCRRPSPAEELSTEASWEEILQRAQGQTVRMAMWDGDPLINAYMRDDVAVELRKTTSMQLEIMGGQGSELVNRLSVELKAGMPRGDIDVMWINGETFYQLRQLKALYGPFTDRLPNNRWIDWTNPFIAIDFQQAVDGYECPWGNVQLALIHRSDQVSVPATDQGGHRRLGSGSPRAFHLGCRVHGDDISQVSVVRLCRRSRFAERSV
jgi:putative spermidine/putrescine transport system substrate-binding protein